MEYVEMAKKALLALRSSDTCAQADGEVSEVAAQRYRRENVYAGDAVYATVSSWAGDDRVRWQRLHKALLRIYQPVWERRDSRDELVSWVAANQKLRQAGKELERFKKMRLPLEPLASVAKRAREADLSFWRRLAERQAPRARVALTEDEEAAAVLLAVTTENVQGEALSKGSE